MTPESLWPDGSSGVKYLLVRVPGGDNFNAKSVPVLPKSHSDVLIEELRKAREQTEAMAWAAGWETDGCPPFEFEAVRKQIVDRGHEEAKEREELEDRRRTARELITERVAQADAFADQAMARSSEAAFLRHLLAALLTEIEALECTALDQYRAGGQS